MSKQFQRNIQFPLELFDELSNIAKQKDLSFAAVVREACINYIVGSIPGLCSLCHTQNNPDAQYCQGCGNALNLEAQERRIESLNTLAETIKDMDERLKEVEIKLKRYKL